MCLMEMRTHVLGGEGLPWGLVPYPVCGHGHEVTRVTPIFPVAHYLWLCLPPNISFPYTFPHFLAWLET